MSADDQCQVRRCRHTREQHERSTVHYTRQDGKPGLFEASGACTVPGCACSGFTMMNGLQPTRPCAKCGEEFLAVPKRRLCPDCREDRRTREPDVLDFINGAGVS
jgi:hypothetical protein